MDISQLHVDAALTEVSVAYQNSEFVAERVAPQVLVAKQSDKYFVGGKHALRPTDDRRRPGTPAGEIEWKLSTDTYYADGHAQAAVIPDEWRANADAGIDLDVAATQSLTDIIGLNKEVDLVAQLVAGATTVDLAAIKWDADANDPVKKVDEGKETIIKACGKRPNVMVMSRPVFRGVRNNAKVSGRLTGAQQLEASLITAAQLAAILEVDELLVADAVKLTSNEGAADASDFVWGKYALLFYRPPSPGRQVVSLTYTFRWQVGQAGRRVLRYRAVESRHADTIEVADYYDQKVVVQGAGLLYSNCVA